MAVCKSLNWSDSYARRFTPYTQTFVEHQRHRDALAHSSTSARRTSKLCSCLSNSASKRAATYRIRRSRESPHTRATTTCWTRGDTARLGRHLHGCRRLTWSFVVTNTPPAAARFVDNLVSLPRSQKGSFGWALGACNQAQIACIFSSHPSRAPLISPRRKCWWPWRFV